MNCRCLSILLLISGLSLAHERENTAISAHPIVCHHNTAQWVSSYESRYFAEGRDNLDGDSLLVNSFEYHWQNLSAGAWYANSPGASYDELQLSLATHWEIQEVEAYLGYTHLRFPFDGSHDNEVGLGLSYVGALEVEYALDAYHSFEADGFFAEFAIAREWELSEKLTGSLGAVLGMNQGYVADGHDGANHVALSAGLSYALSESLTLGAHATYSWAIDKKSAAPDDATLEDFFHAGVGVEWSF